MARRAFCRNEIHKPFAKENEVRRLAALGAAMAQPDHYQGPPQDNDHCTLPRPAEQREGVPVPTPPPPSPKTTRGHASHNKQIVKTPLRSPWDRPLPPCSHLQPCLDPTALRPSLAKLYNCDNLLEAGASSNTLGKVPSEGNVCLRKVLPNLPDSNNTVNST